MTLDVERFASAKIVREVAERPDADGRPSSPAILPASTIDSETGAPARSKRSPRRVLRRARREVRLAR